MLGSYVSSRTLRKTPRSPRLAHKSPVVLCRLTRSLNPKPWPFAPINNFLLHFTTLLKTRNPISGPCLSCFVHEPHAWKIVQTLPMSLTLNKLFYSIVHVFCFLLFRTQNQVIFKTNITQLHTYFLKKKKIVRPLIMQLPSHSKKTPCSRR